ncbi:MAG TPA: hypothetical protein PLX79_00845 [Candidatus Dojkabacteria bacterium]|nr:hypothetical protein [Candidatus Dojkabacteria bacterium]
MKFSDEYIGLIRKIFEKRYNRSLTNEEVELFAQRLTNFGIVIQNFYKRKKEKYGDKYEVWFEEFSEKTKEEESRNAYELGIKRARTKSKVKK